MRQPGALEPSSDSATDPRPQAAGTRQRALTARPAARHLTLVACYLLVGVAVTWPRASYLASGQLPDNIDLSSYAWDLWWVAHQVTHLANPWFTSQMAAPGGVQLGFDTLMPLAGLVMAPVTLTLGPAASVSLLAAALPGLLCYVMFRAARLWLRSAPGAIAAGAFFGLSTMLAFEDWYHVNLAAGALFLPMALEAAVRLRRRPGSRQGVILGLVLGAAVLVDIESATQALALAAAVLLPRPLRATGSPPAPVPTAHRPGARLRALAVGAVVTTVTASPQLLAVAHQALTDGISRPPGLQYLQWAAGLPWVFAPSPRVSSFGLHGLAAAYHFNFPNEGAATYGVVLSALAVAGLVAGWRRRSAWLLALGWLGSTALALGPTLDVGGRQYVPLAQQWHGIRVSALMPYTWLIRLPGMSGFREADRLALLGLVAAALLAGSAIDWLRYHARPAVAAVALAGLLEAGWSGGLAGTPPGNAPASIAPPITALTGSAPTRPAPLAMRATLPALDRPIAADHSGSVVVDVPFGLISGGLDGYGQRAGPQALLLATADGHPRAGCYISWLPAPAIAAARAHPFYRGLVTAQRGRRARRAMLARARRDARHLHVGWVLVWPAGSPAALPAILRYLRATGFRLDYRADGVSVYRPARLDRPARLAARAPGTGPPP